MRLVCSSRHGNYDFGETITTHFIRSIYNKQTYMCNVSGCRMLRGTYLSVISKRQNTNSKLRDHVFQLINCIEVEFVK